jgi:hypothetical protein
MDRFTRQLLGSKSQGDVVPNGFKQPRSHFYNSTIRNYWEQGGNLGDPPNGINPQPFTTLDSKTGQLRPLTEEEKALRGRTFIQDWAVSPMAKSMLQSSIEKDAPYGDINTHTQAITNLRNRAATGNPIFVNPAETDGWLGSTSPYAVNELQYSLNSKPSVNWDEAIKRGMASVTTEQGYAGGTLYNYSGTNLIPKTPQDALNIEKFKNISYPSDAVIYFEGVDKMGVKAEPDYTKFTTNLAVNPEFATKGVPGEHAYVYPHEYSHNQDMRGSLIPFSDIDKIKSYREDPLLTN